MFVFCGWQITFSQLINHLDSNKGRTAMSRAIYAFRHLQSCSPLWRNSNLRSI